MPPDALIAADGSLYGIGIATVIGVATFLYAVFSGVRTDRRNTASINETLMAARINDLVRQVDEYRQQAKDCAQQRAALERENLELMRQNLRMKNGDT